MRKFFGFMGIVLCPCLIYGQCLSNVDLNTWIHEGNPANGNWVVSGGGSQVDQTQNDPSTFFVSPDSFINVIIKGTFITPGGDDDWPGFVFGYRQPVGNSGYYDYYLFDWKQANQGCHVEGYRLIRVDTTKPAPSCQNSEPPGIRVIDSLMGPGTGWTDNTAYDFTLVYTSTRIVIKIDGDTIFDETGCHQVGRFGFFNRSQADVTYQNFRYRLKGDFQINTPKVCVQDTARFEFADTSCSNVANTISSWDWSFGDGDTSNQINPTHVYDSSGTYPVQLIITDYLGCKDTVSRTIRSYTLPEAEFYAGDPCRGAPIAFNNQTMPGDTVFADWQWSFGNGDSSNLKNPAYAYSNSGSYTTTLRITDSTGCSDTAQQQVNVTPCAPTCDRCFLDDWDYKRVVHIDNSANSNNLTDYAVKLTFNSQNLIAAGRLQAGGQDLRFTDSSSCQQYCFWIDSASWNSPRTHVWIRLPNIPANSQKTIFMHYGNASASLSNTCYGGDTTFLFYDDFEDGTWNDKWQLVTGNVQVVDADGDGSLELQSTAGNTDVRIKNLNLTDGYIQAETFYNNVGGYSWNWLNARIVNKITCCNGNWIRFNLHDTDNDGFFEYLRTDDTQTGEQYSTGITASQNNYRFGGWFCGQDIQGFVDVDIDGQTDYTAHGIDSTVQGGEIGPTDFDANAWYDNVIVTKYSCPPPTASIGGVINPPPKAGFTATTVCQGDTTFFTDTSNAVALLTNWNWDFDDGDSSFLPNPTHTYNTFDTFAVVLEVTDTNGCQGIDTQQVTIYDLPVADFQSQPVCYGDTTSFTDLSAGTSAPVNNWYWQFGDGNNAGNQNPQHYYAAPDTYQVINTVTDTNNCSYKDTGQAIVYPLPTANFSAVPVCFGDTLSFTDSSLTGAAPLSGWKWSFGDGDTAMSQNPQHFYSPADTYQVVLSIQDTNACMDQDTQPVVVYPKPTALFTTDPVCLGDTMFFTDSTQGQPVNWIWQFGDGNISTNSSPAHQYDSAGIYQVQLTVRNGSNCVDSTQQPVQVYDNPAVQFQASTPSGCAPLTTPFNNFTTPSNNTQYTWQFGDGNTSTAAAPTYTYDNPGQYTVMLTATDSNNCRSTDTAINYIEVYGHPTALFTPNPSKTTIKAPEIFFQNQSQQDIQWTWYFGTGDTAMSESPTYFYQDTGTYRVQLVVRNQEGCLDSIEQFVYIAPELTFFLPNAFSPNGDETNDVFRPVGLTHTVTNYKMVIWNRWGELIFKSNDVDRGWNGEKYNNGKPAPNGTYLYQISYTNSTDQRTAKYQGYVVLTR